MNVSLILNVHFSAFSSYIYIWNNKFYYIPFNFPFLILSILQCDPILPSYCYNNIY